MASTCSCHPEGQTSVLFTSHLFTLCLKSLTMAITIASLTTRQQKLKKKIENYSESFPRQLNNDLSVLGERRILGTPKDDRLKYQCTRTATHRQRKIEIVWVRGHGFFCTSFFYQKMKNKKTNKLNVIYTLLQLIYKSKCWRTRDVGIKQVNYKDQTSAVKS